MGCVSSFFFPFEDLDWRLYRQEYGERLVIFMGQWRGGEGRERERRNWNWLVSSAIKPVSRRESIFCIVGFLERIQWRAKFRASDRIGKMDRLKSTCMFFIPPLHSFFFFVCRFYQVSRFNLFVYFFFFFEHANIFIYLREIVFHANIWIDDDS